MKEFAIGDRKIGPGHPTYVIAEMSANHMQDQNKAIKIIEAAKEAGADAIKLQTYTPDTLTIDCNKEHFLIGEGTIWEGRTLYDLYSEGYTPWEWHKKLQDVANDVGIALFSTPFDDSAVDFLEELKVPAYKVASFELVDLPLLRSIAQTGKPVILSTGMASLAEIKEAVETLRQSGCTDLALLKCTSAYPAPANEANLATIPYLSKTFEVPAGLSDHTLGIAVPVAAVSLGACIVEKHFVLERSNEGIDSSFSLTPDELKEMVAAIRTAEEAIGAVNFEPTEKEKASMVFRRSLFVVEDIKAGEVFTEKNLRCIRPGYGLHSRHLPDFFGEKASCDIQRGTPLSWDMKQ